MTLGRLLRATVAALVGLMLLAPAAAADGRSYRAGPGHLTKVHLKGSGGYDVGISTGPRHGVIVRITDDVFRTDYWVRGFENGRYGVKARFPGFGQINFRFVPNGREQRVPPPPLCEGQGGLLLHGVARGRIQFRGEHGYTEVAVGRAKATVETWPGMRCHDPASKGARRSRKLASTFIAFREASPFTTFSARRYPGRLLPSSRQVVFQADTYALGGPLRIYRSVAVAADVSSFVVPDPKMVPENLVLAPPPPFSGTASLRRTPESVFAWEGDLSIQFPGTAPLALAGSAFSTSYCTPRRCVDQSSPEFP